MTFQEIIFKLINYWSEQDCVMWNPYDIEVGAGTFNPSTFLMSLGPEPWNVAYVEPSRRPKDGRYGENPNRLYQHHQFQVIMKPSPPDIQDIYLGSLKALGIDPKKHDIRFVEDNWESPTLGAWGLGWEVWLDGMEITQFTYFQQVGGIEIDILPVELTYGLERLSLYIQKKENVYNIEWAKGVKYGDIRKQYEYENSKYSFELADIKMSFELFEMYEKEANLAISNSLVFPAYDYVLKCSHVFNILDARGAISTTERVAYILRVRDMAKKCAELYLETRRKLNFPLLRKSRGGALMDVLLEIGIEEFPARYISTTLSNIKKNIISYIDENRITFEDIKTYGTPRRLVIHIKNLDEKQLDVEEIITGPKKETAYDSNGELTRAGIGFIESQNLTLEDIEFFQKNKGEYIGYKKSQKGKPTVEILPSIIKDSILNLKFKKSMKWSESDFRFPRPIQWFLALANDKIIDFEIGNIRSSDKTNGLRFFGEKNIVIENIEDYFKKIKENYVILDVEERKSIIVDKINEECLSKDEKVIINQSLLEEVAYLVEYPYPMVGNFNSEFLEVKQEMLIISMETHQRYFPITDENGKLLPKFILVRNGIEKSDLVIKGNEKVLSARLSDARFFYDEDLKNSLETFVEKLKYVVFQKDLGTIYDKIDRMKYIGEELIVALSLKNLEENILKTIRYAKADLVSNVINEKEFAKLQGLIGAEYARKHGEEKNVAKGIEEHYLPKFNGDIVAKTNEGIVTALADKFDTLVGCFGVGVVSTGSKDPFSLRRTAQGIVLTLLENDISLNINRIVKYAIAIFEEKNILKISSQELYDKVISFMRERCLSIFEEKKYDRDIVEAIVSKAESLNVDDMRTKIEALTTISEKENFKELVELIKRVGNISEKHDSTEISPDLFVENAEKNLFNAYVDLEKLLEEHINNRAYLEYFNEIYKTKNVINSFFDNVLVNTDEESLRNNRLSLLKALDETFVQLADIKRIG